MLALKFKGKVYYPHHVFKEFEIAEVGDDYYEVQIDVEIDGKIVKVVIYSGNKEDIERMISKGLIQFN